MTEFRMPSLGADMDEATLVEWKIRPGDHVKRGDVILAAETSKGVLDVEIFEDGIVEEIRVPVGEKVPVGAVLAILRAEGETLTPGPSPKGETKEKAPSPPSAGVKARLHISPAARKRAEELRVNPDTVKGSGPDDAITLKDVEKAARAPTPLLQAGEGKLATDMRAVIGAAMTRSKREIPHYYLDTTVDLKRSLDWLDEHNRQRPVTERLLYGALLIRAVARALVEWPEFNGYWKDGAFRPGTGIHVGIAISLRQGGLVAPALHDADRLSLDELMQAFRDLVNRARSGRLRASELADGTITVTSLGERSVESVYPVIYPPQVAIVGFGTVIQRPVVTGSGAIEAHPVVHASLAADHRASDGHRGGKFLATIGRLLQEPEKL